MWLLNESKIVWILFKKIMKTPVADRSYSEQCQILNQTLLLQGGPYSHNILYV